MWVTKRKDGVMNEALGLDQWKRRLVIANIWESLTMDQALLFMCSNSSVLHNHPMTKKLSFIPFYRGSRASVVLCHLTKVIQLVSDWVLLDHVHVDWLQSPHCLLYCFLMNGSPLSRTLVWAVLWVLNNEASLIPTEFTDHSDENI